MRVRSVVSRRRHESAFEPLERLACLLWTVDPRRAEEDDGVLNVLRLESPQRFQVLGENAQRARLFALEKLLTSIREWLGLHEEILSAPATRLVDDGRLNRK